jgi:hypothetical protein
LRAFLDAKQIGGDWESFQTPPTAANESAIMMLLLGEETP